MPFFWADTSLASPGQLHWPPGSTHFRRRLSETSLRLILFSTACSAPVWESSESQRRYPRLSPPSSFSRNSLGDAGMAALAESVSRLASLVVLEAAGHVAGPESLLVLAGCLVHCRGSLARLDISNNLGMGVGVSGVVRALQVRSMTSMFFLRPRLHNHMRTCVMCAGFPIVGCTIYWWQWRRKGRNCGSNCFTESAYFAYIFN
jgi:hypothetical protein